MITMITDRIGIGDAADGLQLPLSVDATLNVASEHEITLRGGDAIRHKVGLIDSSGNDDALIIAAVLVLHSLNKKYNRILVHCREGGERSITIVAIYVAIVGDMPFDKVYGDILFARQCTVHRKELFQQAVKLFPLIRNMLKVL